MFHVRRRFAFLLVGALTWCAGGSSWGRQTTVAISGVGTRLGTINTHVDQVTYGAPRTVEIDGFGDAVEIRGTVAGIGWGGIGIVSRATSAHYAYRIPFVARWQRHGAVKGLVAHLHGGDLPLVGVAIADRVNGDRNLNRRAESLADQGIGVPALTNRCAYVATNRRGLREDGTFSATYLPSEVPPLTVGEVNGLYGVIAPSDPSYRRPGLEPGSPVPLTPTNDVPTFRDVHRALEIVLADLIDTNFRTRILSGHSNGARLAGGIDFGASEIGTMSIPTGGNNVVPYDLNSPRIFDGFLLLGFPYATNVPRANPQFPISAPTFFLQGRGDERYQDPIRLADELLAKGVDLNQAIRIYEVKGLPHVPRGIVGDLPQPSEGDAVGCFVSAAIKNMISLLRDGVRPPRSRIAGRIENGGLVFDVAGGASTIAVPIIEDPAIDSIQIDNLLNIRVIGPAETARWQVVTSALDHMNDSITPPTLACRLGGYRIRFFGAELAEPFSPVELASLYKKFNGYRACLHEVVDWLDTNRLYDAGIESANETAEFHYSTLPRSR